MEVIADACGENKTHLGKNVWPEIVHHIITCGPSKIQAYVDDVLIANCDEEEHLPHRRIQPG